MSDEALLSRFDIDRAAKNLCEVAFNQESGPAGPVISTKMQ